jgi:hypothetical protein
MSTQGEQKIEIQLSQLFRPIYWGALALGALFVLSGWNSSNGMTMMIVGCFLGIVSRIIQAEHHHQTRAKVAGALSPEVSQPRPAGP